jgi:hypothetical protein
MLAWLASPLTRCLPRPKMGATFARVDAEVDARLDAFTDLAERCERYVREERGPSPGPRRRCSTPPS